MSAAAAAGRAQRSWFTARSVAKATGGDVLQDGATGQAVATDTREECAGAVFVALRGDQHDSHDYLDRAVARGCAGLVVDRDVDVAAFAREASLRGARPPFVVRVADTGLALLELAREHRRRSRAKVVGITGSCGKTTTKEWLGAVLAAAMPTERSPASFNNKVGVPLTLFRLSPETRAAVVEIGTNAPGEIAQLTGVARPDIGVVTCVAPAHLEGLGSLAGVAREKSSLPRGLSADGLCLLNGDDPACREMAAHTAARVEWFGIERQADWFATDLRAEGAGTSFLLQGARRVTLPHLGAHNVSNALAVIAAAHHLGVPEDLVLSQLAAAPSASRRLERKRVAGVTILDDTYNMNPASARSSLQALADLSPAGGERAGGGRSIVVFGGMAELGDESASLHHRLGEQVAAAGRDLLVCVGAAAEAIAAGAIAAGMAADAVACVADAQAAYGLLNSELRAGDVVLCKASRRVRLDVLVDQLVADLTGEDGAEASRG